MAWSLGILGATALGQAAILALSGSVALFADLIHNLGEAPYCRAYWNRFTLRSARAEKLSGRGVVAAIFVREPAALRRVSS